MTTEIVRDTITVPSQALGAIEVARDSIITVCEPLAGFPDCSSYTLVEHTRRDGATGGTVFWLQAVERPFHAFVVTDPWGVFPQYSPEISDADATDLGLAGVGEARVFAILTVPRASGGITVNLRAPIVVNMAASRAKQVVLLNDEYHTRHPMTGPLA